MILNELLVKTLSEIEKAPLDSISVSQIEKALSKASGEDKIKLQSILRRRKQLDAIRNARKSLESLDVPDFD